MLRKMKVKRTKRENEIIERAEQKTVAHLFVTHKRERGEYDEKNQIDEKQNKENNNNKGEVKNEIGRGQKTKIVF